jgi:hypothetical protein
MNGAVFIVRVGFDVFHANEIFADFLSDGGSVE